MQFDWEYVVEDVQDVRFGVVVENNNVAILVKTKKGTKQNNRDHSVEWIRNRVEIIPGKRASFIIRNVVLKDSTTFFCQVIYGFGKIEIDKVKLSVVGEYNARNFLILRLFTVAQNAQRKQKVYCRK